MSKVNSELKKIVKNYYEDYDRFCKMSREERLKDLRPGEPAPKANTIYGNHRTAFDDKAADYRAKAMAIIDSEMKATNKKLAAAPSTDAVNAITLLKMRDNVSREAVSNLLDAYGDNVQAFDTIRDIAKQKGIATLREHPMRVQMENIEAARSNLYRALNADDTARGHNSAAFVQLINSSIDAAFEPDPDTI